MYLQAFTLDAIRRFFDLGDPFGKCSLCSSPEHHRNDCPQGLQRSEPRPVCELCELEHLSVQCPLAPLGAFGRRGHKAAASTVPGREHARGSERSVCRLCGKPGHRASICPEPWRGTCFNCDQPGHLKLACPYSAFSKADAVAAARADAEARYGLVSAGKSEEPASAASSVSDQLSEHKVHVLSSPARSFVTCSWVITIYFCHIYVALNC